MKKIFTFASLLSIFALATAQNVSTEPQYKNILIEEYTGVKCGNCPDGHAMAHELQVAKPENVFVIAVHAGHYATPSVGMPNFITDDGTALNDFYGVNSYPSGSINRRAFDSESPIIGRSQWTTSSKIVNSETAPVNLYLDLEYDDFFEKLTINVEGYWTATPEVENPRLAIALLQNNIQGYQAGSGVSDEYMHQHVLRDFITDAFGDELSDCAEGNYFSKSYTYTLPEEYSKVEVVPEQLEVVAFVVENEYNVLNVTGKKLSHSSFDLPMNAEISESKLPISKNYHFSFFEMHLENKFTSPITSASFEVEFNGTTETVDWTGEIPALSFREIAIPVKWTDGQEETNSWSVTLSAINGEAYAGNTLSGTFGLPFETAKTLKVIIKTDEWADDNQYLIRDTEGNVVHEFGPYENGLEETYTEEITLEVGNTYCFEVSDIWGDGVYSPRGHMKIYDDSDKLVCQNMEILDFGWRTFISITKESGIEALGVDEEISISADGQQIRVSCPGSFEVSIYDSCGRCVKTCCDAEVIDASDFGNGLYIISVTSDKATKTSKIIL